MFSLKMYHTDENVTYTYSNTSDAMRAYRAICDFEGYRVPYVLINNRNRKRLFIGGA